MNDKFSRMAIAVRIWLHNFVAGLTVAPQPVLAGASRSRRAVTFLEWALIAAIMVGIIFLVVGTELRAALEDLIDNIIGGLRGADPQQNTP